MQYCSLISTYSICMTPVYPALKSVSIFFLRHAEQSLFSLGHGRRVAPPLVHFWQNRESIQFNDIFHTKLAQEARLYSLVAAVEERLWTVFSLPHRSVSPGDRARRNYQPDASLATGPFTGGCHTAGVSQGESPIDGRPRFAKLSIDDGGKVQIAAIDPDFAGGFLPPSLMESADADLIKSMHSKCLGDCRFTASRSDLSCHHVMIA